jgi:hypothetical protein
LARFALGAFFDLKLSSQSKETSQAINSASKN